jgi:hypothetical protein
MLMFVLCVFDAFTRYNKTHKTFAMWRINVCLKTGTSKGAQQQFFSQLSHLSKCNLWLSKIFDIRIGSVQCHSSTIEPNTKRLREKYGALQHRDQSP